MADTIIGKVSLTPKGEYNPATQYERLDVVQYQGSGYIVRKQCQGVTPVDGDTYMLAVERGEPGGEMTLSDVNDAINIALSNTSPFTRLEYIRSSGTQYIDTGIIPNQDTRVCMRAVIDVPGVSESAPNSFLFGARLNINTRGFVLCKSSINFSSFLSQYGGSRTSPYVTDASSADYSIDFNCNVLTMNGRLVAEYTQEQFAAPCNLILFGCATGSTAAITAAKWPTCIYFCQIYDNGTLVRDYVPCRNFLGEIGLYDKLNKKFYGNNGNGEFIAGPDIQYATTNDVEELKKYIDEKISQLQTQTE